MNSKESNTDRGVKCVVFFLKKKDDNFNNICIWKFLCLLYTNLLKPDSSGTHTILFC